MKILLWKGDEIKSLSKDNVLIVGTNPEGRHGKGLALLGMKHGLIYGQGRGLMGNAYGLITKNLKPDFIETLPNGDKKHYPRFGVCSVSLEDIKTNIEELVNVMKENPDRLFFYPYKANNTNLNGYDTYSLVSLFFMPYPPNNIVFHESLKDFIKTKDKPILP